MKYTIKGQEFQHANLRCVLIGKGSIFQSTTFSAVNWKDGAAKKPAMNQEGKIDGYTIDNQVTDGSLTLRRSEFAYLQRWARLQNPGLGIGQMMFTLRLAYGNALPDLAGHDELDVMFNEMQFDSQNNQETHMIVVPLFVHDVRPKEGRFIEYTL